MKLTISLLCVILLEYVVDLSVPFNLFLIVSIIIVILFYNLWKSSIKLEDEDGQD